MPLSDLIATQDLDRETIEQIIATAVSLRAAEADTAAPRPLAGRTVLLAFLAESMRTRASFVTGADQLGAEVRDVSAGLFGVLREKEAARAVSRIAAEGDGLAIRHPLEPGRANAFIREIAAATDRPVYNMQCELDHPIQTLADLMTLRDHFGALEQLQGRTIAVTWAARAVPDRPASVSQGLLTLLTRFGMEVRLAHPPGFELPGDIIGRAQQGAAEGGGRFVHADDMDAAVEGADVVYPRSWAPAELLHRPAEAAALAKPFSGWIMDEDRFARAASDARFMHCLPAHRGEEVSDAVIDGDRSLIYAQSRNRLAVVKSVLVESLGGSR